MNVRVSAGLAGLLMLFATEALAKCAEKGTAKAPFVHEQPVRFQLGGAVFEYRNTEHSFSNCDKTYDNRYLWGAVGADGKTLVPPIYDSVMMVSPTRAIVRKWAAGDWRVKNAQPFLFYDVGKGESPAPAFQDTGLLRTEIKGKTVESEAAIPFARVSTHWEVGNGRRWDIYDYHVYFDGSNTPRVYKDVGGPGTEFQRPMQRYGDIIVATVTSADRIPRSRIINLQGEPISPVIGHAALWSVLPPTSQPLFSADAKDTIDTSLMTVISTDGHPDLPWTELYGPITPGGAPKKLPDGVIGVFPLMADLMFDTNKPAPGKEFSTYGWGAVSSTSKGLSITVANGPLDSVLALVGKAAPVAGVKRYYSRDHLGLDRDILVFKSATDGRWRPVRVVDHKPVVMTTAAGFADPTAAYNDGINGEIAYNAMLDAERKRRNDEDRRALYARQDVEYKAIVAAGQLCANPFKWVQIFHVDGINHMLSECDISDYYVYERAKTSGADPALLSKVSRLRDSRQTMANIQAQADQAAALEWERAHAKPNMDAWANAVLAGAQASTDAFMAKSRDTYITNLKAWNSGAQNWGGPAPAP